MALNMFQPMCSRL